MLDLLFNVLLGLTGGVIGSYLFRQPPVEGERPYRWTCPEIGCFFEVEANEVSIVDRIANDHRESYHG